jgi:hypothetical protein
MELNVGLDNMQEWKRIREKTGKVSNTKAYVTDAEEFPLDSQRVLRPLKIKVLKFYTLVPTSACGAWSCALK